MELIIKSWDPIECKYTAIVKETGEEVTYSPFNYVSVINEDYYTSLAFADLLVGKTVTV